MCFIKFPDDEITHSEMLPEGRVEVYIETTDLKDCLENLFGIMFV